MQDHNITLPVLATASVTRGILGFGAGLLISQYIGKQHRIAIGWSLVVAGALSTIPIAIRIFRKQKATNATDRQRTDAATAMAH